MREKIIASGQDPNDFPILREQNCPVIFRDIEWVWEGFSILSGSRQMSQVGPQSLVLSEILAYLDYGGITDPDEREEFIFLVQSLDRRFMADAIAKTKARSSQKPPPGKSPR